MCSFSSAIHYEKLHLLKPHYHATKTQKKLIYNYYVTIVLGITMNVQLSP